MLYTAFDLDTGRVCYQIIIYLAAFSQQVLVNTVGPCEDYTHRVI